MVHDVVVRGEAIVAAPSDVRAERGQCQHQHTRLGCDGDASKDVLACEIGEVAPPVEDGSEPWHVTPGQRDLLPTLMRGHPTPRKGPAPLHR